MLSALERIVAFQDKEQRSKKKKPSARALFIDSSGAVYRGGKDIAGYGTIEQVQARLLEAGVISPETDITADLDVPQDVVDQHTRKVLSGKEYEFWCGITALQHELSDMYPDGNYSVCAYLDKGIPKVRLQTEIPVPRSEELFLFAIRIAVLDLEGEILISDKEPDKDCLVMVYWELPLEMLANREKLDHLLDECLGRRINPTLGPLWRAAYWS